MRRVIPFLFIVIAISACKEKVATTTVKNKDISFFVGTYTDGNSEGIYKYALNANGTLDSIGLEATVDNPSFLAKTTDGKYLLAINEIIGKDSVGTIKSFLIENDSLKELSMSSSGGAHPCFVTVNDDGYVLTANYTGGNVGLLHLDENGKLSPLLDLQQHSGKGTTERQQGPHAHSAWFNDNNRVISIDLGTNELWLSHLDTVEKKLVAAMPPTLQMAPGAGPRHLSFHPNHKWIYVVNELNGTVQQVIKTTDSTYTLGSVTSTLPEEYSGENTCADIHCTSDGQFLYVSNRGHNSIAIFKIDPETGNLAGVGFEPVHGNWPRNFTLSPNEDFLLVANQKSNNIVSFKRDTVTGLLEFVGEIQAPSPVCLLF